MTSEPSELFNRLAELGGSEERLEQNTSVFINAPLLPDKVTRAVPDVPELVRYDLDKRGVPWVEMEQCDEGDYVLHSQAAAMLAAKDEKISQLADAGEKILSDLEAAEAELAQIKEYCADKSNQVANLQKELAQIKAQNPVAYLLQHPDHENEFVSADGDHHLTDEDKNYGWSEIPLYAEPVDQTAEIERLRSAGFSLLASIDADNELGDPEKFNAYHDLQSALSGKELS